MERGLGRGGDGRADVRKTALGVVMDVMERGAFLNRRLNDVLDRGVIKGKKERAFLSRLCEGVVERAIELDYVIDCFSKVKTRRMRPVLKNILRMAVYQIFYMDAVTDGAACDEAAKLAAGAGFKNLTGFVNGTLRSISREKENVRYPAKSGGFARYASVKYSMPEWIVQRYLNEYGEEDAEKILESYLSEDMAKKTTLRCNISKIGGLGVDGVAKMLKEDGANVERGRVFPYALRIGGYDTLTKLRAFNMGFAQVQDEASMLPAVLARLNGGDTVIDVCAAPGGKAFHAADILNGTGKVIACDLTKKKLGMISGNLNRVGFRNMELRLNDALCFNAEWEGAADAVIADLPCSGLGVIGKKSDIKYKTRPEDVRALAARQKKMLGAAVRYLKPGGRLIYSTCTIAREENEENVRWAAKSLPVAIDDITELLPEALKERGGGGGYVQLLPFMAGTDGFFAAAFTKK